MHIMALDLGGYQATACHYDSASAAHQFLKIRSTPQALHDVLVEHRPARLVFEIGPQAGWVHDVATGLEALRCKLRTQTTKDGAGGELSAKPIAATL
jgi:hypothetical protein